MIVDREQEIQSFIPQEYWTIEVELAPTEQPEARFRAKLVALDDGTKLDIDDRGQATKVAAQLEKAEYLVKSIASKQLARQPAPPFITSTLQQEAWRKLRFTAKRTMAIAQELYEGLPLEEGGSVGLITYMRTDSTHIAASALAETRDFIVEKYGNAFLPPKPRRFAKKAKWAQEAHEAIRPTSIHREPEQVKPFLNPDQLELYRLIWRRAVASQMSPALYNRTDVQIQAKRAVMDKAEQPQGYLLEATSSTLKFPGFITLYSEGQDEDEQKEGLVALPDMGVGDRLSYWGTFPEQHFTQPLPRYTEATLIRALEQKSIGRPSTYASILSIIQERDYVKKTEGKFYPSELGTIVNGLLAEHFPQIVDLGFTAQMEGQLDEIARGEQQWISILENFYPPFEDMLRKASVSISKVDLAQPTDETCPNCGRPMVIKVGRFGKFLACSGYPECKTTKPLLVKIGIPCPQCGAELVEKVSKRRQLFYGCSNYPKCKFATGYKPISQPCPHCGKLLVIHKKGKAKCLACGYELDLSDLEAELAHEPITEAASPDC